MKKLIILLIVFFLLVACTSRIFIFEILSYTTTDLKYDKLIDKYKNIKIPEEYKSEDIVKELGKLNFDNTTDLSEINGNLSYEVYIDKNGEIESIFLLDTLNSKIDDIVLTALKNTQFKIIYKSNDPIYYYVPVIYKVEGGEIYFPVINGESTENLFSSNNYKRIDTSKPIDFFMVDQKPEVIKRVVPEYPLIARKTEVEGVVVVTVIIDELGDIIDCKIFKTPDPVLNRSSIDAAYQCKFIPGKFRGKTVKVRMNIPFMYRLK